MCGITGIFTKKTQNLTNDINIMLNSINHRGLDDCGYDIFDINNNDKLALGHKRLSIIDLSKNGHQPMIDNDNKLIITYNGEIFNFQQIKQNLVKKGYKFRTNTDTEVVLYSYKEYGKKCLDLFRGFFAFCIYDVNKQTLFLARDRLGSKPLKYYFDGETFAFSSEIKSFIYNNNIIKKINYLSIEKFLTFKYIPAPLTIFENIFKLEAGHYLEFNLKNKNINIKNYWQPINNNYNDNNNQSIITKTENILQEAINIRMISDVPIGVFLSGGIDSSVITALLRKKFNGQINTFTMGFEVQKFDERKYAQQISDKFDTNHTELLVSSTMLDGVDDIITSYDEPFADPSIIPMHYLTKETSKHIKVALGGDGGDEIFGGYKRYDIHSRNNFLNYIPNHLLKFNNYILNKTPYGVYKKQGWGKVNRVLEYISYNFIDGYHLRVANFTHKEIKHILSLSDANIWSKHIYNNLSQYNLDNLSQIMLIDQLTHLPEYILTKSDIAGMNNNMELRAPFIDYKLVNFVNSLPQKYKKNKILLKEIAMKNGISKDIVNRKKMGFTPPLRKWSVDIKPNITDLFFSSNALNFLDKNILKQIYNFHYTNDMTLANKIWGLYVLGIWLEKYNKYIDYD